MQHLIIDTEWNQDNVPYIRQKLREYNIKHLSDSDVSFVDEDFCFTIKDEEGKILGGISGNTKLQSLFIQFLWVDESIQRRGFGRRLIKSVEDFAVEKNCRIIKVDTFSFQAPAFYKSLGFEVYGTINDFPEGHNQYFLYKRC